MKDLFFTITFLSFFPVRIPTTYCIIQVTFYTSDLPSWQPDVAHSPTLLSFLSCQLFCLCFMFFLCDSHPLCIVLACCAYRMSWLEQCSSLLSVFSTLQVWISSRACLPCRSSESFSCLALQELPELTSLIYPKFFLLLFSLFLAVHRNK